MLGGKRPRPHGRSRRSLLRLQQTDALRGVEPASEGYRVCAVKTSPQPWYRGQGPQSSAGADSPHWLHRETTAPSSPSVPRRWIAEHSRAYSRPRRFRFSGRRRAKAIGNTDVALVPASRVNSASTSDDGYFAYIGAELSDGEAGRRCQAAQFGTAVVVSRRRWGANQSASRRRRR